MTIPGFNHLNQRMKFWAYRYLLLIIICFFGKSALLSQSWMLDKNGAFVKSGDRVIALAPQLSEQDSCLSWALFRGGSLVAINVQLVWRSKEGVETTPLLQQHTINTKDSLVQAVFSFEDLAMELSLQLKTTPKGINLTVSSNAPLPLALRNEIALRISLRPAAFLESTFIADQLAGIFPLYPSPVYSTWPDGRQWLLPMAGGRSFTFIQMQNNFGLRINALKGGLSLEDRRVDWLTGFYNLFSLVPVSQAGELVKWEIEAWKPSSTATTDDIIFTQTGYHARQAKLAILPDSDQEQTYAELLNVTAAGKFTSVLTGPVIAVSDGNQQQLRFDFSPVQATGLYVIKYAEQYSRPFLINQQIYQDIGQATLAEWLPLNLLTILAAPPTNRNVSALASNLNSLCQIWDVAAPETDHKTFFPAEKSITLVPDGEADVLQWIEMLATYLTDLDFNFCATETHLLLSHSLAKTAVLLKKAGNGDLSKRAIDQAIVLWEAATEGVNDQLSPEKLAAMYALWQATNQEQYLEQYVLNWNEVELSFDTYIAMLVEAYPSLSTRDQNSFRRLAVQWERKNSKHADSLLFTVAAQADYPLILSRAINCWLLHKAFPEQVGTALMMNSLNYLHGLHQNGGRSLVAGTGLKSCYVNSHSAVPPNGSFWQKSLAEQATSTAENSLLAIQYLQLLYIARDLFPPAGTHYRY